MKRGDAASGFFLRLAPRDIFRCFSFVADTCDRFEKPCRLAPDKAAGAELFDQNHSIKGGIIGQHVHDFGDGVNIALDLPRPLAVEAAMAKDEAFNPSPTAAYYLARAKLDIGKAAWRRNETGFHVGLR